MKSYPRLALIFLLISASFCAGAQSLQPGFSKAEYLEHMKVCARITDSSYYNTLPAPQHSKLLYRSPITGLDNMWDLWLTNDNTGVISIRGTTANQVSWLENFYAAMVPAKGDLVIAKGDTFHYNLTNMPRAAVHVGWLTGLAYMAPDMLQHIDSLYKKGIKNLSIIGHSQGGALAFLLTSYLYQLQEDGKLPADLRIKTYCSAAPKPGNLYYAYSYEQRTQFGWAYNVLNPADWVPESPISVQTVDDYNNTNPYTNTRKQIRTMPFTKRVALMYGYNKLDKPARKLRNRYKKYLGKFVGKAAIKNLPGYEMPDFYNSSHFVRCGNSIVLKTNAEYYRRYPDNPNTIFVHHFFGPYLFLAEMLP